ncbi:hypothetical protein GCM10010259_13890 [Streptomyces daghestanicus]|uniref:Uncharacterized protein n=1 Tax=Streptomyces daghestanicus TaxID=66885 RepID=A0ABQ3PXN1_9ACTN|nr:hypothetical protein GCM10010240_37540 [Streptomyces griseoviridis]GGU24665.1 hypothetical protein GCM10010259_13890 [Streptomyces daghestanicus]GHI29790.1 hypothetical protein Sdagh_15200 [Streptomyces daghestanicus]
MRALRGEDAAGRATVTAATAAPALSSRTAAANPAGPAPDRKEEHNACHRGIRAHVEHASARTKSRETFRGCRLKDEGVPHTLRGTSRFTISSSPDDRETKLHRGARAA